MDLTAMDLTVIHLAAGLVLYSALRLAATPRCETWSHRLGLLTGMSLVLYTTVLLAHGLDAVLIGGCVAGAAWALGGTTFKVTFGWRSRSWTLKHGEPTPGAETRGFSFRMGTESRPE